jgi:hypothetical protein
LNLELIISAHCQVSPGLLRLNGNAIFRNGEADPTAFLKAAYRGLHISYPKFFKMDNLCKLAFLTAEPLLSDGRVKRMYPARDIGIILQNSSSSLTTDERHQETIANRDQYFPSPSVFVYTLPNIMTGEMAIRHGIKGENAVHITPAPDPQMLWHNVTELFFSQRIQCCLAGYVEEYHERLTSCLFLVEKSNSSFSSPQTRESIIFDPSNIERFYKDAF